MARTWLSITVELVEGRGKLWWPRPGRVLIARRSMTFADLADAIDSAFARWDRAHLHLFVLGNGTRLVHVDDWWGDPPAGSIDDDARLSRLTLGEQFAYEFDMGDGWKHLCTVAERRVDPWDEYGAEPDRPVPVWGWGSIPDQYGRRFAADDGESDVPPQPDPPTSDLPGLMPMWGDWSAPGGASAGEGESDAVSSDGMLAMDVAAFSRLRDWDREAEGELRAAVHRGDGDAVVELLLTRDALEVAHLAGEGLLIALDTTATPAASMASRQAEALVEDLRLRLEPGDIVLADQLATAIGAEPPPELRRAVVDLDELVEFVDGQSAEAGEGWRLDVRTGRWWHQDPMGMAGEEPPPHWEDADRWVSTPGVSISASRDAWEDMQAFAGGLADGELGERLLDAIEGRGAFRRFRVVLEDEPEDVLHHWLRFRDERRRGRARSWLAREGWVAVPAALASGDGE